MIQINTDKALTLIKETNGRVFTAVFTKKDGTTRKMNCRLGVSKHVTGQGLAFNPASYDLMPVYDMKAKGYRMLNLKTLTALQVNGRFYVIIEE